MDNYKENGYGSNNGGDSSESSADKAREEFVFSDKVGNTSDAARESASSETEAPKADAASASYGAKSAEENPDVTYHYTGGTERPFTSQSAPHYGNAQYSGAQYNGQGYSAGGYNNGGNYPPYIPTDPPKKDKKNKKEKKARKLSGMSTGAIAVLCAGCILVSGGVGFLGAMTAGYVYKNDTSSGGSTVIYKNPETSAVSGDSTGSTASTTLEQVAAAVSDSVVEITTEFKVQSSMFQYVSEGAGSGVIISADGYIVTNNHVIVYSSSSSSSMSSSTTNQVADTITITLRNGDQYTASVVGRDSDADIAVLKIDAEGLSPAVVGNSDSLNVGTEVIAVGNPLGELGGTVTNGIISALDREIDVDGVKMNLLQTNAAVNPGNSGGGLFNMSGELVGIVNAKSSGTGVEGLGFAIPVNDAMDIVEQLMSYGYVRGKVYIGVSFYNATDAYSAYSYFKSQSTGIYVAKTEEGYNDDVLQYGDRLIAIDGAEVTSVDSIKSILKEHSVGDTLTFTVYRNNILTEVTVTCYESQPADNTVSFETSSN